MFLSKNKKNNVYPCKPQFNYIEVGRKGVKSTRTCFPDDYIAPFFILFLSAIATLFEGKLILNLYIWCRSFGDVSLYVCSLYF